MKIQNIIIGVVAVFALVFGIMAYNKTPEKVVGIAGERGLQGFQGSIGAKGDRGERGLQGEKGVKGDSASPTLGSVASPNIISRWLAVNGVKSYFSKMSLNAATTTICTMQAPTEATSTLAYASVVESVSSTTASIIDIARSSNTGATTTLIGTTYSIGANAQAFILASTSPSTGTAEVFAPGQYLVVNQKGGANNVFSPTGQCVAEWRLSL